MVLSAPRTRTQLQLSRLSYPFLTYRHRRRSRFRDHDKQQRFGPPRHMAEQISAPDIDSRHYYSRHYLDPLISRMQVEQASRWPSVNWRRIGTLTRAWTRRWRDIREIRMTKFARAAALWLLVILALTLGQHASQAAEQRFALV